MASTAVPNKTVSTNAAARFGTFAGVFTPNVLTILGLILFLRMEYVVGQAGLWGALVIVALGNTISLLTGLSLSAIATNMTVRAGGNYYIISRSLGLEVGGAIGIPLYLSQAISIAFYVIGFTESLLTVEYFTQFDPRLISTIITFAFVLIAYIGADFALKIQYFIFAVLLFGLGSFFIGGIAGFGSAISPALSPNFSEGVSFWIVFAIFFPAVTGIEVGVSLSGDLANPSHSIPRGTILSIIFTAAVYVGVTILMAYNLSSEELLGDTLAMGRIAILPQAVLAGVWASTLSSALGSILAAPRTLQAIANDNVVPKHLASTLGSKTEPRMAVLVSGVIALIVIWAGDLNAVAPIISMFFLNTYGMVNLTSAIEKLVDNPSFRPRFRIPWWVSLLGAVGCYAVMLLINLPATIVAIVVSYGFFIYLQRRSMQATWGDVRSGVWFALSRWALLQLEQSRWTVKNWRPNIIVFTGQPHNRQPLVEVAKWLSLGQGLVTFFQLIVGDAHELAQSGIRETARKAIQDYIAGHRIVAFAEADIVPDFRTGATILAQGHGIGGITANSILMGWSGTAEGRAMQMAMLRDLVALHKSVMFLSHADDKGFGKRERLDVWWQGRGGNEDLMLLLAYFIERHPTWNQSQVRLIRVIDSPAGVQATTEHMATLLNDVRVDAEPLVIVNDSQKPIADIIAETSNHTDLTILGMALPNAGQEAIYAERLNRLVEAVGAVLLVRNAEDYDLLTSD
ncbi:MAG: amino acid permease [Anaerolineae bacterium]|nr:amino acid permease [Anaerolineae bacterium]MDQ7035026.1 amino acid permease [Anaerolineae bacterium]